MATQIDVVAGVMVRINKSSDNAVGKVAEAELIFTDGPLEGLKLIGFSVWERREGHRAVTFPARQYSVNGERRSFALLRPALDSKVAQERIINIILTAYNEWGD